MSDMLEPKSEMSYVHLCSSTPTQLGNHQYCVIKSGGEQLVTFSTGKQKLALRQD